MADLPGLVPGILRLLGARMRNDVTPVLLIDGRSGSGKTTLGALLNHAIPGSTLVRLDDLYPGWDGLDAGSLAVRTGLLEPLARGRPSGWRAWNWSLGEPGGWHPVLPGGPVIVEGCGALTAAHRALASLGVWVELDTPTRRSRALDRDGAAYAPHWDRWAAQELAFINREDPKSFADLVVDGRTIAG